MKLITTSRVMAHVNQIWAYQCDKCGRQTFILQRDPGLVPSVMRCRALGENACDGWMLIAGRRAPGRDAPKPTWQFYRPTGMDFARLSPQIKEIVAMGVLDDRELSVVLVR